MFIHCPHRVNFVSRGVVRTSFRMHCMRKNGLSMTRTGFNLSGQRVPVGIVPQKSKGISKLSLLKGTGKQWGIR